MKKRMTAMILMLLMVWMLAPGTALGENFSLQEASVQCPYDAIWLSVSPSGRYLIGYNNDGMDLQSTQTSARLLPRRLRNKIDCFPSSVVRPMASCSW